MGTKNENLLGMTDEEVEADVAAWIGMVRSKYDRIFQAKATTDNAEADLTVVRHKYEAIIDVMTVYMRKVLSNDETEVVICGMPLDLFNHADYHAAIDDFFNSLLDIAASEYEQLAE